MDVASLIGILMGIALVVTSIGIAEGSSFDAFIDYPSILVVIGGSIAASMTSFPLKQFFKLPAVMKKVFLNKPPQTGELIEQLVSLAETARRDGLLALENRLAEVEDPFVALGIQMAIDGTQPEIIENILRTEMDSIATRHRDGKSILESMGRFAPAYGMIGTLMGLVIMLRNMEDTASIGSGMAVALITTLYGAISANMFFLPFAEKLGYLSKQEMLKMEIALRGIMAIQSGENPRIIEQKLSTFLPPHLRKKEEEENT